MSPWIPFQRVCAHWQVHPAVALRRIEKLVDSGAVEFSDDRLSLRITWPREIVASFADIHAGSMTEG
jgi:hypothetical protein